MTLDEAIAKYKIRVEQYKNWDNMKDIAEEHEQLAEWLEELKERRRMMKEYGHCGYLEADIRNKAIDDFLWKATKIVYEANNRDRKPQPRDMVADIHYKLLELAEQLKEGSADNE